MSKQALDNAIRNDILDFLRPILSEHFDTDVLEVGSVDSPDLTIPVVDSEGNEKFAVIKISIPRGTRSGDGYIPYDGYAEHEEWKLDKQEKENKINARKEKAEHEQKEKERRKAARKVIKKLNTEGLQAMIHEDTEEDDPNQFLPQEVAV